MTANRGLILFARSPAEGQVKTRLEPVLGQERTLALYERLLGRQIQLVNNFPGARKSLWVDGNPTREILLSFQGEMLVQIGSDIGERMNNALNTSLAQCESAVLIGCDCPGLSSAVLEQAFRVLEEGADAVFVPATDGGYVLVGLRRPAERIFQGVTWGESMVMVQTRAKLAALDLNWIELKPLQDIDEPADLEHLHQYGDAFSDILGGRS